jgi:hypothetical protein
MRFYREAFVQGLVENDGRIDRDGLREIGIFQHGYPFPEGPMDNANIPFRELQGKGLIHFPDRNRYGARGYNREPQGTLGLVHNLVEGSRRLERNWGLREPNAPFLPNAIHRNRRQNPYRYTGPPPNPSDEPVLFNVPRQTIYGSPEFESVLTLDRIPEGTDVIRITGRT